MRAALRSRARTFARALDMPDEWETDRLALDFECMFDQDHIAPSMDHTILPRAHPNPWAVEAFDLHAFEEVAGRMGVVVPEYRPA